MPSFAREAPPTPGRAYALRSNLAPALVVAAGATVLRLVFGPFAEDHLPFLFFWPAVLLCTLHGGVRLGAACAVFGLVYSWLMLPLMRGSLEIAPEDGPILLSYAAVSAVTIWVTDRRQRVRPGRLLRQRDLGALVDQAQVGIAQADLDGRLVFLNGKFCRIAGWSREELLRKRLQDITHPDDLPENLRLFERLIAGGEPFVVEKRYVGRDGSETWVQCDISLLTDREGRATGTVAVVQDVTDRKRKDEELERLNTELVRARDQALEGAHSKGRLLASMSHELRTPLNAVIGYAELAKEELEDSETEAAKRSLRKVLLAGGHLLSLINDVLDFSKIEAGKMVLTPRLCDVQEVALEAIEALTPLMDARHNRVIYNCESPIGPITVDQLRLRQILLNLLSNAGKFTENGTVTVACRREPEEDGHDWVAVSVRDTGVGMSPEQMERLFQEFEQLEDPAAHSPAPGTGLGLAIAHRLTEIMGGRISVESEPGKGSTFTVHLPATGLRPLQHDPPAETAAQG